MTAKQKAQLEATFTDESPSPTTAPPVENPDEIVVIGAPGIVPFQATRRQLAEVYEPKNMGFEIVPPNQEGKTPAQIEEMYKDPEVVTVEPEQAAQPEATPVEPTEGR